ncbi:hypothetical protein F4775DRAFT_588330 [Biscogniauxia sp. FL1348]|nr:hypothetical protein F4775DRAFT_588330 [Biscogniauxia sp. FL1348]
MEVSESSLDFACNLPELLAVDLEESSAVFQSRKLTAGAPAPALADDGSKRRYSLQGGSLAPGFPSKHGDGSSRFRSLQTDDQKYSELFTIHIGMQKRCSVASSECSGGMEPPSIATTRDESVVTAATSVDMDRQTSSASATATATATGSRSATASAPDSCTPPTPLTLLHNKMAAGSWMDLEFDEGAPSSPIPLRRHNSMTDMPSPTSYLLKSQGADDLRSMSLNSRCVQTDLPKDPFAAFSTANLLESVELSSPPQEKRLSRPTKFPQRRSSLNYKDYPVPPQFYISSPRSTLSPTSPTSPPPPPPLSPPRSVPQGSSSPHHRPPKTTPPPPPPSSNRGLRIETTMREEDKMSALSSDSGSAATPRSRRGSQATMNPEIVSPRDINIENWLESTVDMFAHGSQSRSDGPSPLLPLPANVIDTLRVSVSCFPETMLLCSSLSIETIRSRSRRVKHRTDSMNSDPRSPQSQTEQHPKPSKWKWLPSKKQTTPPASPPGLKNKQPYRSEYTLESLSTSNPPSPFGAPRAEWAAIKNLFPSGTDYLCDALYAHLLAYNYITSICPRSALISPMTTSAATAAASAAASAAAAAAAALRPSTAKSSSTSSDTALPRSSTASIADGTQIPRKAATLLGLQDNPRGPIPEPPSLSGCGRNNGALRPKRSYFVMGNGGGGGGSGSTTTIGHRHANSSDSGGVSVVGGGGGGSILTARPTTSGGSRSPPDHSEQTLREVRLGLARCIARLVATLRQNSTSESSEGGGAGGGSWGGSLKPEEDPLFMRALCEIVRCCEER